jgi:hypothetical protein
MFHIADTANRKTKSFIPFQNWRYSEGMTKILDSENGVVCFGYYLRSAIRGTPNAQGYNRYYNVIYDAKKDIIIYESPSGGESISLNFAFT